MSFVTTQPEALSAAAANLAGIGSALNAQNAAAAAPTTGVVPAAADEVSALTAAQFAAHAQMYQAVSAQATAIHELFVNTLTTSSGSYAATEAAHKSVVSGPRVRGRNRVPRQPPCRGTAVGWREEGIDRVFSGRRVRQR